LMGQSAGSMSVGIHTTNGSEISKKVKNAIMQSPYMGFGFKDEKSAAQIASSLKKDVEDKTSKSIYEADPLSLIYMSLELTKTLIGEHFPTIAFKTLFPYSPYIDNSTIKLDLIKSKTTVPLLIGNNNDEINFMLNSIPPSFIEAIDAFKKEKNPDLSYSEFLNLYAFKCSTRYFTQSNGDNSYFYHNSFVPSFAFFANKECQYPAICHGSELPFVFNNFYEQNGTKVTPTDADKLFSHNIMSKWGEFSKSSYITGFQKYSPDGSMIYIDNNIPNFFNVGDILKDKCSSFNDYY
ncbi:MAG: carboxylesterase family protein, partial [Campylobacterota bacterium]|nr:carboxylesterase family protein [Campylobacterota bacterium]